MRHTVIPKCQSLIANLFAVKTRYQRCRSAGQSATLLGVARDAAKDGPLTLYRGFLPKIAGVVPMRVTFWGAQSAALRFFESNDRGLPQIARTLAVGVFAGTAQSLVDAPMDYCKVRQMTSTDAKPSGVATIFRDVISQGKIPGAVPTLARNVTFAMVFSTALHYGAADSDGSGTVFLRGAAAGAAASMASQPFDTWKTMSQVKGAREQGFFELVGGLNGRGMAGKANGGAAAAASYTGSVSWWRCSSSRLLPPAVSVLMSGWQARAVLATTNMAVGALAFTTAMDVLTPSRKQEQWSYHRRNRRG